MSDCWIGDWLLLFDETDEITIGRTEFNPWQMLAQHPEWRLICQPTTPVWQGFPCVCGEVSGWRYWLLGELYSHRSQALPALLERIFRSELSASHLNGHFLLCAWHEATRQWHVWTDRFGTFHAYYAHDGRRAALGTYFGAVSAAASQRRLDWAGLTSFFTCGFFLQDRTYYEDVRILRPATHLILNEKAELFLEERYWDWVYQPDVQRSYEDTVTEFAHHFHEVMHALVNKEPVAVPISGGLDSRSTVAALTEESRSRVWAYSYGYNTDSIETQIATQIAQTRHLAFQSFTITPYLFDQLPQVIKSVEGFQDVTHSRQASIAEALREQSRFVIAAHWGDVWLDDMGLLEKTNLSEESFQQHAWKKMVKKGYSWLNQHLCQPHLGQLSANELVRSLLNDELERVNYLEEPDFRLKAFKTEQWSARWTTASIRMYQPAAFPRLPFYDTRIADFFTTVPSHYLSKRQLQIDYLKRFAPDLARIEWQGYGANLYHYQRLNTFLIPLRAWRKLVRAVKKEKLIMRNWEVQFLQTEGREEFKQWLLRPGLRLHDIVAPQAVAELLAAFWADPDPHSYAVSMLLTFSAWLEIM